VRGEPDVIGSGDHDVGDHTTLEAAHPVGQDLGRYPPIAATASATIARVVEAF
jgi:hypothetical protein